MGLLRRIFCAAARRTGAGGQRASVAMVLLSEPRLPAEGTLAEAFAEYASSVGERANLAECGRGETDVRAVSLALSTGESAAAILVPAAVPKGEAEVCVEFSLSAAGTGWELPPHCAHLIVTMHSAQKSSPVDHLSRFASVVASVVRASPAVGVYLGAANATHKPEFFLSLAAEGDIVSQLMLWSGFAIGYGENTRLQVLSLGMKQFDLPDVLVVAGTTSRSEVLEMALDLLAYTVERGKAPAAGDTVGRTEEERCRVTYVPSPVDASRKVWRVELP